MPSSLSPAYTIPIPGPAGRIPSRDLHTVQVRISFIRIAVPPPIWGSAVPITVPVIAVVVVSGDEPDATGSAGRSAEIMRRRVGIGGLRIVTRRSGRDSAIGIAIARLQKDRCARRGE